MHSIHQMAPEHEKCPSLAENHPGKLDVIKSRPAQFAAYQFHRDRPRSGS